MYTQKQMFFDEVQHQYSTIVGANDWARDYFAMEMPKNSLPARHAEVSARRCWRIYQASFQNSLGFLLLGEVSMRSKLELVPNLGLTSAHGHEDDEPWLGRR